MKLLELFKKSHPYEVMKQTASRFMTSAKINGREIRFHAVFVNGNHWVISFGEKRPGDPYETAEMTGSGGSIDVLNMVFASFTEFVETYTPKIIEFTSSKGDRARTSVYNRLLKRQSWIKDYTVSLDQDAADEDDVFNLHRK